MIIKIALTDCTEEIAQITRRVGELKTSTELMRDEIRAKDAAIAQLRMSCANLETDNKDLLKQDNYSVS